ncbi:adducin-related protein 2-like isoform X2 [Corticium candelabrum]|uniref:adducin-related protein 2-like isoform X2 n=1 Tax=Corticium candelabrum TaxID=121492 RepID=UPI002E2745BD|nr:adducin-related protein 2-like isoform X2 [Corticium candelabrum]
MHTQLGEVVYHKYEGIVVAQNEREELAQDLGEQSKILMLQNHGFVALGSTTEEAFSRLRLLVNACKSQVDVLAARLENIILPGVDYQTAVAAGIVGSNDFNWGRGELEWDAEMRKLDLEVTLMVVWR